MAFYQDSLREIIACLMCSTFYFKLPVTERLALVKRLAKGRLPGPNFQRVWSGSSSA